MQRAELKIVDVTIKEGGFAIDHHWLADQVTRIAQGLEGSGIRYAEIGHGRGVGAQEAGYPSLLTDREFLEIAKKNAPRLQNIVYFSTYDYSSREKLEGLKDLFEIGRVGINIDEVSKAEPLIGALKDLGKTAIAQLLRVHAREAKESGEAAKILQSMGADVIYATDSFGSMGAEDVKAYLSEIRSKASLPLGFQAHNATGRAIEATLAALEAGAEWLDASLLGQGQGAGLASLEILVALLQDEGHGREIDLSGLGYLSKFRVQPAIPFLPFIHRIDLLGAQHKIDFYPQILLEKLADLLDMDLEEFLIALKKTKGERVQLRRIDLNDYLAEHRLDLDVVIEFFRTGQIPRN